MVEVYLEIENQQILALSIPFADIERLTIRPLKWLRFVAFAICGVRGGLSATPNGPPVNYNTSLTDPLATKYYYAPQGELRIIDHNGLNDKITSTGRTMRSSAFRASVIERDGPLCVFTGTESSSCDAAHLLSKSKGNEYISVVLEDRRNSYPPTLDPGDLDINSIENALLLSKNLHSFFGLGHCAFLATPNFALDTADIPMVDPIIPMPPSRLTLHHLKPDNTSRIPLPQWDARTNPPGTGIPPPSTILLDYMYGVASYRRWGTGQGIKEVMKCRFDEQYKSIPIPTPSPTSNDGYNTPEPDDLEDDPDYIPDTRRYGRGHRSNISEGMLSAMDDVHALSMLVKGRTPESIAAERERQEEAAELRTKEASKEKVQGWRPSVESPDVEFQSNASYHHTVNVE